MPTVNNLPSDEKEFHPNFRLQVDRKEQSTSTIPKPRPASGTNTQQSENRSAAPTGPTALPPHRDSLKIKHIGDRDSGAQQQSESRSTPASTATARLPPKDAKYTSERDSGTQQSESRSTTATTASARPRHDPQDAKHAGERAPSTQQSESRPTTTTTYPLHEPSDAREPSGGKLHSGEQGPRRKDSSDTHSDSNTTTNTPTNSTDRHQKPRSGLSNPGVTLEGDLSESDISEYENTTPRDQEQPSIPTSNSGPSRSSINRVPLQQSPLYAQVSARATSKDHQGATEDTSVRGSAPHQPSSRSQDTRAPPGHYSENGQQNRTSESQGSGYTQWISNYLIPGGPPLRDTYQNQYHRVKDELKQTRATLGNYDRELRRRDGELRQASQINDNLRHENQRLTDNIRSLQNELYNVHQQFQDAKNLSEVRGKELVGSQVFLTKADTLSISEVGEKVTALNEEIFQAAAALADALVHKRHEVSQTDLDAAAALSQEMVGEKMTKLLIDQSQKPEPEVNPLLVQVVLQIFMVKFCVSKIQSWYPGDPAIGGFLSAIYSQIRSSEEQAVSGRWRALTRANTRPSTDTWNQELYQRLQSVLVIASWAPRSPESEKSFENRLHSIFKAVNELRLAIGEKFTSADLDIFVFECDHIYDPAVMEDAYGDDRQSSGKRAPEPIVGTTGIGLSKLVSMEQIGVKDVPQLQSLVRAKIVLTSTVHEALEPVQSTTRGKRRKIVKTPVENAEVQVTTGSREGRETRDSKADV